MVGKLRNAIGKLPDCFGKVKGHWWGRGVTVVEKLLGSGGTVVGTWLGVVEQRSNSDGEGKNDWRAGGTFIEKR